MSRRYYIWTIVLVLISFGSYAQQQSRKLVNEGNMLYQQKKYKEAAADYQKALNKNPTFTPGIFNLGNALYQQKQYDAARKALENTVKLDTNKLGKSAANYNIGNTYMAEQKWEDAIDAYKKTLRANPQDADAKYNLSYAQQMLKKQQQNGGGKNDKNNKDKKDDKNKDNKDNKDKNNKDQKDKDNKDQDKNGQDNKDKDNKDQDNKHPEPQPSKLTQKQAEQLLNALQQEEKKLQDKHKKEQGVPIKVDKDW